jgi:hypothetical protein
MLEVFSLWKCGLLLLLKLYLGTVLLIRIYKYTLTKLYYKNYNDYKVISTPAFHEGRVLKIAIKIYKRLLQPARKLSRDCACRNPIGRLFHSTAPL